MPTVTGGVDGVVVVVLVEFEVLVELAAQIFVTPTPPIEA